MNLSILLTAAECRWILGYSSHLFARSPRTTNYLNISYRSVVIDTAKPNSREILIHYLYEVSKFQSYVREADSLRFERWNTLESLTVLTISDGLELSEV
jgi:hypothetical protein